MGGGRSDDPGESDFFAPSCASLYTPCLKTVHFCLCQNFVKFPPTLINFDREMTKWLKLYAVQIFSA